MSNRDLDAFWKISETFIQLVFFIYSATNYSFSDKLLNMSRELNNILKRCGSLVTTGGSTSSTKHNVKSKLN